MYKIIGIENVSFKAQDGNQIEGFNLYLTSPIDDKRGVGSKTERIFCSSRKLSDVLAVCPHLDDLLGESVIVYYNRYGKVERVLLAD